MIPQLILQPLFFFVSATKAPNYSSALTLFTMILLCYQPFPPKTPALGSKMNVFGLTSMTIFDSAN